VHLGIIHTSNQCNANISKYVQDIEPETSMSIILFGLDLDLIFLVDACSCSSVLHRSPTLMRMMLPDFGTLESKGHVASLRLFCRALVTE